MEKELYNSLVLDTYVRLIEAKYPDILIEDLMEYAGIENYEIGDATVWFTQTQVNRFHEKLDMITDDIKIAREAGRFAADPKCMGELRGLILSLGGICNAFRFMGRYAQRLNRSSEYTTRKISKNQMEVTVTPFKGITEQKFQCENRQGNFRGIADAFTHKEITISHPECLFEGANTADISSHGRSLRCPACPGQIKPQASWPLFWPSSGFLRWEALFPSPP